MPEQFKDAFDLLAGMPMHPVVAHFAVVGTPVIALVGLWALIKRKRDWWKRLAILATLNLVVGIVVKLSGEAFVQRAGYEGIAATNHTFYAKLSLSSAALMLIAFLLLGWFDSRRRRKQLWVRTLAVVLLWASALLAVGSTAMTALSGTQAVWQDEIEKSN